MKNFMIVLSLVALAGCATPNKPTETAMAANAPAPTFGLWQVKDCKVQAERAGITLSTTKHLSNDTIHLRLNSAHPLVATPKVSLNALPHYKIELEGKGQNFGAELPYSGRTVARMIRDDSFITVKFTPQTKAGGKAQQAYFSTRGLAEAVTHLAQKCK